jgi:predicted regulator of Ras-like GTPase activity (Roadblock/LC7/MglB family)
VTDPDLAHLTHLLKSLLGVPHTKSAVLLSADGLVRACSGMERADAETLAAVASGMFSLATQSSKAFGTGGPTRQVAIDNEGSMLLVTAGGQGSVLVVVAEEQVETGVLAYEMLRLANQVPAHFATPARPPA